MKNIIITITFATELKPDRDGETVTLTVNPTNFNLDTFADDHTNGLVINYLLAEKDTATLQKLQELQRQINANNPTPPDDNPPSPLASVMKAA